jgi:LAS superfamily LD-carboxypeptidase LdcB
VLRGGVVAALVVCFGVAAGASAGLAEPMPAVAQAPAASRDRVVALQEAREADRAAIGEIALAVRARADAARLDAVGADVPAAQLAVLEELTLQVAEMTRTVVPDAAPSLLTPSDPLAASTPVALTTDDGVLAAASRQADRVASLGSSAAQVVALDVGDPEAVDLALPQVSHATDAQALALRRAVVALANAAAEVTRTAAENRAAAAAAAAAAQAAAEEAARQAAAAAAAKAAAEAARQAGERSVDGYLNGEIPASALCAIPWAPSETLRCDAEATLEQMNAAYAAAFGTNLVIGDSYRSYEEQLQCRAEKGSLCADPGTSNHGWGLAVDFGGDAHNGGTASYQWLVDNAGTYGWRHPDWASATYEPWHWEYGTTD